MKRQLIRLVLMVCFFLGVTSWLYGGTTGKIAGKVFDAETNEPLPGVNVTIAGTTMGDATDLEGDYQVINLPPGVYTMVVSMMGYTTQRIEGLQVNIDLTTTRNVRLNTTVLEAGEEVTVVAERPVVQMDMTGSMSTVVAEEIRVLPAQSTNYLVGLTAGVVDAGGIHIRGGRSSEVAYWVDGVATTDAFTNSSTAAIENSAVEELQVISGTFNAEYGQAMSGIINIITKDGGSQYHGEVKGYVGDYVSADDEYAVLTRVWAETDPETNEIKAKSEAEDPLTQFNPTYNLEGSLNGPVPGFGDKLSFFLNGRYYQQEGYLYGREWFLPSGLPGDSSLVPMQESNRWTGLGKLTWAISPSIKLRYSINATESSSPRYFSRYDKFVPGGLSKSMGNTTTHLLSLNQVLSNSTFYELKVNRMSTHSESYLYDDPNVIPNWLVRVPADSTHDVYTFSPAENSALFDSLKQYGIQYNWVVDPNQPVGYVSGDSSNSPIAYSYARAGNDLGRNFRSSAYWIAKFDLTSQLNDVHQIKGGAEVRLHELDLDNYTLRAAQDSNGTDIVPFQPIIPIEENLYRTVYDEPRRPAELSVYVQDKIELRDIIMNLGLRFDYFNSNYYVPVDPMDPSIYTPMKAENKYINPGAAPEDLVEYTPEQRKDFMWTKSEAKTQISPRVGIAYPITDKGVIHFSYGHFFQIPDFQYLYAAPGFKLNTGGGNTIFGNANIEPQRTTQYEIGLQQELGPGLGIDVTLFYRDIRDWVDTGPLKRTVRDVVAYSTYINRAYANVRGITFRGEQRFTNLFSAKVDYSFQIAEGTYSNPTDAYNAELAQNEPRRNLIPLNWDQNHTLNFQLMFRPQTWTMSLVGRFNTGLPYTPSFAKGAFVGGVGVSALPENSARRPDIYQADLYVTKRFPLGKANIMLFAYVYNLFDNRMATNVFSDTGSPEYTTDPDPDEVLYNPIRIGTVEDYYKRPEWYIAPRQVQLGLSLGF
ncbi:TonB-dependent receptor [candidate division KSB1 bacterium]|nr:MAG: TonB-dependent receptor [candidate division KSB1 bacterium]